MDRWIVDGHDHRIGAESLRPGNSRGQRNAHILRNILSDEIGVIADELDARLKTAGAAIVVGNVVQ